MKTSSTQNNRPTCGPLYLDGLKSFTGMKPRYIKLFAAGFISGQAEKLYLRACSAAMFRPSAMHLDMVREIVAEVATRYGLLTTELPTSRGVEVWICSSPAVKMAIDKLPEDGENSAIWHRRRGVLCGIPPHLIDLAFHERSGYGETCDA